MLAFYGLGIYKSIDEAVKNMYKVGKIIHPNTNNISLYEKIYQNAYLKIYQNLKPIYKELKNIL